MKKIKVFESIVAKKINENNDPSLDWVVINNVEKFQPNMNEQGQVFCSIADGTSVITWNGQSYYKENSSKEEIAEILEKMFEKTYYNMLSKETFKEIMFNNGYTENPTNNLKLIGESIYNDVVKKLSFGEKEYKEKIKGHEDEFDSFSTFINNAIETQKDEFGEDDLVNQSVDLIESVYSGLPNDSGL